MTIEINEIKSPTHRLCGLWSPCHLPDVLHDGASLRSAIGGKMANTEARTNHKGTTTPPAPADAEHAAG